MPPSFSPSCWRAAGQDTSKATGPLWLNVVPASGGGHVIEWRDLDDGSSVATIMREALAAAAGSAYGTSTRQLNESESQDISTWMTFQERAHNMRPLPIRYDGRVYHVGLDGMG